MTPDLLRHVLSSRVRSRALRRDRIPGGLYHEI